MGRYVPPELEGTATGNQLHRKRAPGSSGPGGAMTVRFEMPFAVWCAHCPQPTLIGQGVRFNAEKRRVGHYHSTPIFAFRIRHAACAGALEIRTDPQNTTYVVTEGGRKRDTGENKGDDASAPTILTPRERDDLRGSAFAKLERTIEDRARLAAARDRIGELEAASARAWDDPYERNRVLRREFRAARHERERDACDADDLRDRLGFGPELVPASDDDARRAALVDFRPVPDDDDGGVAAAKVLARPLFEASGVPKHQQQQQQQKVSVSKSSTSTLATTAANKTTKTKEKTKAKTKPKTKPLKSEIAASQSRETLVSEIVGNTRAAHDPFLAPTMSTTKILGIKRKRQQEEDEEPGEKEEEEEKEVAVGVSSSSSSAKAKAKITGSRLPAAAVSGTPAATTTTTLVEYDSDST